MHAHIVTHVNTSLCASVCFLRRLMEVSHTHTHTRTHTHTHTHTQKTHCSAILWLLILLCKLCLHHHIIQFSHFLISNLKLDVSSNDSLRDSQLLICKKNCSTILSIDSFVNFTCTFSYESATCNYEFEVDYR